MNQILPTFRLVSIILKWWILFHCW